MSQAQQVLELLDRLGPLDAHALCNHLGWTRHDVNSVLYSGAGRLFARDDATPPKWRTIRDLAPTKRADRAGRPTIKTFTSPAVLSVNGREWKIAIVVRDASLGDPMFEFERKSAGEWVLVIASYVNSGRASVARWAPEDFDAVLDTAACAIASLMLAEQGHAATPELLGARSRDVLLELAVQLADGPGA